MLCHLRLCGCTVTISLLSLYMILIYLPYFFKNRAPCTSFSESLFLQFHYHDVLSSHGTHPNLYMHNLLRHCSRCCKQLVSVDTSTLSHIRTFQLLTSGFQDRSVILALEWNIQLTVSDVLSVWHWWTSIQFALRLKPLFC